MHLPLKVINKKPSSNNFTPKTKTSLEKHLGKFLQRHLPPRIYQLLSRVFEPTVQSVLIITFFLLLSRGLGFIRQILIYQKMDQISSDLLLSAVKLPETIISFLVMGTIATSVLPVASRIESKTNDQKLLSQYFNLVLFVLLSIMLGIVAVLMVFTEPVLKFVTSTEIIQIYTNAGIFDDYVLVTRILLTGPLLFSLQSIFGVYLTMKKQFLVFSSASVIYNIGTVASLLIAKPNDYTAVALGMTAGATIASLLFWITAAKVGLQTKLLFSPTKIWQSFKIHKQDFLQTCKLFLPRIFLINGAVFANLIIIFIAQNEGQVTALDIGLSIQALFLVLIGAVGTVFFPDLAKLFHLNKTNTNPFWEKLFSYTEKVAILSLIGGVLTFVLIPLVLWFFELFGKGQDNAEYIILLARIATMGLVFQSVNEILSKYFFVRERVWQPVLISVLGTLMQLITTFLLIEINFDAGVVTAFALVVNNLVIMLVSFWLIRSDYKKDLHKYKENYNGTSNAIVLAKV